MQKSSPSDRKQEGDSVEVLDLGQSHVLQSWESLSIGVKNQSKRTTELNPGLVERPPPSAVNTQIETEKKGVRATIKIGANRQYQVLEDFSIVEAVAEEPWKKNLKTRRRPWRRNERRDSRSQGRKESTKNSRISWSNN